MFFNRWELRPILLFPILFFPVAALLGSDSAERDRPIRAERDLVYGEVDGKKLLADVYRPDDAEYRPGVLLIHGGAWSSGDKWNMSDHARELAQSGYVVVNVNYRLAPLSKHPAQIDDCRRAMQWMSRHGEEYKIDLGRLAVYGYSAGGHLAALLATEKKSDVPAIKVAIVGGAPCDFSFIPANSRAIAHVMGGTPAQIPQAYRDASPITHASSEDCPFFFFHGESDLIVPPSASRTLCERLSALGVETCYYSVEKQGHLITFIHPDARRAAIKFLDKHLQRDH